MLHRVRDASEAEGATLLTQFVLIKPQFVRNPSACAAAIAPSRDEEDRPIQIHAP